MTRRFSFSLMEWIKTLVIFAEIVLMLVLMLLLMIGQNGTREEALPLSDRMVVYSTGFQPMLSQGMDTARVSPYMLAYRRDGGDAQILHAVDSLEKPYAVLYPLLRSLFGANAVGYALDGTVGADLFAACAERSDYIYVRYVGALPSSVIRAYTYSEEESGTASYDEHAGGDTAYVREVFFLPVEALRTYEASVPALQDQGDDAVCALTRDDAGSITLFCGTAVAAAQEPVPAAETEVPDAAVFSDAASSVSAASAEMTVGGLDDDLDSLAALAADAHAGMLTFCGAYGMTASLSGVYRMPDITLTPFDPAASLYTDAQKTASVFGLLGMRERDTDNYYTDTAGSRVYLNAQGRLTVSSKGTSIRYDALQEGGLDLADYLGYASVGGNYLLSEYLRAADRLLSQLKALEPALGGDALTVSLIGVHLTTENDADTLELTYGYTYRGIPLFNENGEIRRAMVVRARGGVISHLELYPCGVSLSEAEAYLLPQTVAVEAMALEREVQDDADACPCGLYMAYLCGAAGEGDCFADWIGLWP